MASFYGGEKGQPFKAHAFKTFEDAAAADNQIMEGQYFFITTEDKLKDSELNFKSSLWEKKYTTTPLTANSQKIVTNFSEGLTNAVEANSYYYELITYIEGRIPQLVGGLDGEENSAPVKITIGDSTNTASATVEKSDDGSQFQILLTIPRPATLTQLDLSTGDNPQYNTPSEGFTAILAEENGDYILKTKKTRPIRVNNVVSSNNELFEKDENGNNTTVLKSANATPEVNVDTNNDGDLDFNFKFPRPIGIAEVNTTNDLNPNSNQNVTVGINDSTGDLTFQFDMRRPIGVGTVNSNNTTLGAANATPQVDIDTNNDGDLDFNFKFPRPIGIAEVNTTNDLNPNSNQSVTISTNNSGDLNFGFNMRRPIEIAKDENNNKLITSRNDLENANSIPQVDINTDTNGDLKFDFKFPRPLQASADIEYSQNASDDPTITVDETTQGDLAFNFNLPRNAKFGVKYNVIGSSHEPAVYTYPIEINEGRMGYSPTIGHDGSGYIEYTNPFFIGLDEKIVEGLSEKDYLIEFFIPQSALKLNSETRVSSQVLTPNLDPEIISTPDTENSTLWNFTFKLPRAARFKMVEAKENSNIFENPQVNLYTISNTYVANNITYYGISEDSSKGFEKLSSDTYEVGDYIIEFILPTGEIFGENPQINYSEIDAGVTPTISLTKDEIKGNYVLNLQTPKAWTPKNIKIESVSPDQKDNLSGSITLSQKDSYDINLQVPQGEPAGFGEITTTVSVKKYGTEPEVNITPIEESPATEKSFNFDFAIPEGKPFEFSGSYTWTEAETETLTKNSYVLITIETDKEMADSGKEEGIYVYKCLENNSLEYVGPFISGDAVKGAYKIEYGTLTNENVDKCWIDLIKEKPDNAWFCVKDNYEYPLNKIEDTEIYFGLIVPNEDNQGNFKYLVLSEKGWEEREGLPLGNKNLRDGDIENTLYQSGIKEESGIIKNAKVISPHSVALGVNTLAGSKGFYFYDIDFADKKITLNMVQSLASREWTNEGIQILEQWEVGDSLSIVNDHKFPKRSKIITIDSEQGIITVDFLPFNKIAQELILLPSDYSVVNIKKPNIGYADIGLAACVLGIGNKALGMGSYSEGIENITLSDYGHSEGKETQAGYAAHSEGQGTWALGDRSHSEGKEAIAYTKNSHAEGEETVAGQEGLTLDQEDWYRAAHAEGLRTKAIRVASHAEGMDTRAEGDASHAEGKGKGKNELSIASGIASHVEGYYSSAKGDYSHAEGNQTLSKGIGSHVEGLQTKAYTKYSHAEGEKTEAGIEDLTNKDENMYRAAHAEGLRTKAIRVASHAEGIGTIAESEAMHVQGKYNVTTSGMAHVVGWGTESQPKDIHSLDTEGNAWFAGEIDAIQFSFRLQEIIESIALNAVDNYFTLLDENSTEGF